MRDFSWRHTLVVLALPVFTLVSCKSRVKTEESTPKPIQWAIRMADSEMKRFPEAWMVDSNKKPRWGYTQGLEALAFQQLWLATGDQKYYDYQKGYADSLIAADGTIKTYQKTEYNLDQINSGKILFYLYEQTGDPRYKAAIDTLRNQLLTHPRTADGGFWHKHKYTHQMWLDGIYMADPFLAQYAAVFNDSLAFDDVVLQVKTIQKHTYDPKTGLNFHGWDESKEQKWANPETGCSPNFWGRSVGWYSMALVDILDYLPENHPGRPEIITILDSLLNSLINFQDKETGLWYQVLDQGGREGNYLEATASSMFVYSMTKAVNKGYVNPELLKVAQKGFDGIIAKLIKENEDGTISLTQCCSVAGLGGNPYRDGSYEYYIGEPVRDNDPKGTGPFILACLELNKANAETPEK